MEKGVEYAEAADREILVMINIESKESINNLDEILSVEGIDAVFIGGSDLSISLFGPSGLEKRDSPKYKDAIQKILEAAERHGVSVRGHGPMRTIGFDDRLLLESCKRALSLAKKD